MPKTKFFFGDLKLEFPSNFDKENFNKLLNLFDEIKGEPYSLYSVNKILG
jgi:outer membrane protein insertion porin family